MSTNNELNTDQPNKDTIDKGEASGLNSKALQSLVGFFDVLIQMDLKQINFKERNSDEESLLHNPEEPTQSDR